MRHRIAQGFALALACAAVWSPCRAQTPEEDTQIVGSSTVSGLAAAVLRETGLGAQGLRIETTGTTGGFSLFCASRNPAFAPLTLASRPISDAERRGCAREGAGAIEERALGKSGIVVAHGKRARPVKLTTQDLFLALAARIPDPDRDCAMIANPNLRWSDVRDGLPNKPIEVFGPPLTSGTRASFIELAMVTGAKSNPCMARAHARDPSAIKAAASSLRADGAWIDAGENDNVIVTAITHIDHAVGIVGFPLYAERRDRLAAASIDGVAPNNETISAETYPLSRTLYVYARMDAVKDNAKARRFLEAIGAEEAAGADGYLKAHGLAPISAAERAPRLFSDPAD